MLNTLVDYARDHDLVTEPGFKPKMVRWLLIFSKEGNFTGPQDLRGDNPKGKGREFRVCPDLTQPEMVAVGDGCRHFLVDSLEVVALLTIEDEVDDKLLAKHEFFVNLLKKAAICVPELESIGSALGRQGDLENIRRQLIEYKAKPTDSATLAIETESGVSIIVDECTWHDWWRGCRSELLGGKKEKKVKANSRKRKDEADDAEVLMRCFLSGEPTAPLPTHNKIEGLSDVGGLATGDALTSFDKDAFASFGLAQGANAAMSETMAKTYASALNDLIRKHSHRLAGVKIVYWYDRPAEKLVEDYGDLFGDLWGTAAQDEREADSDTTASAEESAEETRRAERAKRTGAEMAATKLLDAIHSGTLDKQTRERLADAHYYAMTLSANSGRVVIRDWMEGRFEELARAIDAWFADLAIIDRFGQNVVTRFKFFSLVAASVRDVKDSPVAMQNALLHCAIKNAPIPRPIMTQTLRRVQLDIIQGEPPRHARYALLKSFYIRHERIAMSPELNELETNPAYLCGRIIAILDGIQEAALPDVKAGVVERFYAAASTTPALILGRMVRTAIIAHLPKIDKSRERLRGWLERQLTETWAKLHQQLPPTFSLEQQTLVAMGFYHQKASRYSKKDDKAEDATQE